MNRSVIAAATAALMAGPLAAAGVAASLDGTIDDTLDLTCEEARETEDLALIEEFCDDETEPTNSTDTVTKTTDDTTKTTTDTVTKTTSPTNGDGGGGGDGDSGSSPTDEVLGSAPSTGTPKERAGNTNPRGISDDASGKRQRPRKLSAAAQRPPSPLGYDANGPIAPGLRSHSALTLQPFAAPVVSGGFMYELPQIAEQLFGDTGLAGAEDPMVAASSTSATEASPYSQTGYTTTPADANGWLAATATGLIMLVGAGHALNGGRTPKRQRA